MPFFLARGGIGRVSRDLLEVNLPGFFYLDQAGVVFVCATIVCVGEYGDDAVIIKLFDALLDRLVGADDHLQAIIVQKLVDPIAAVLLYDFVIVHIMIWVRLVADVQLAGHWIAPEQV